MFLYVPYLNKVISVRCCRPFQPAGSPCGPGGGSCPAGDSYSPTPLLSPFTPPHHTTISPPHTTPQQVAATHHHTTTTPITIHAHQQMRTNNCQTKYNNKCIHKHLTLRNAADLNWPALAPYYGLSVFFYHFALQGVMMQAAYPAQQFQVSGQPTTIAL